ncbi:glycoside hydrolase family 18 protein [Spirochaeta lutea]|uniref:chitinase n=1 Tax=Spirochaeta lutea TaxID=1480694 RepID=A0A098QUA5_9SPIO|nr:glycoside hydrolase family 18 protein [Spirochaeta lutea]KGE71415.1 hypothetical protein DC28_11515 [Spirochaeta lutea]
MKTLLTLMFCVLAGTAGAADLSPGSNLAVSPGLEGPGDSHFTVTAYAPGYALGRISEEHLRLVDRIIYFGIGIRPDGRVAMPPQSDMLLLRDWHEKFGISIYLGVVDHEGAGSTPNQGFGRILRSPTYAERFRGSLDEALTAGPFDGVDIDWEWPASGWETEEYGRFLSSLAKDLRQKQHGLSIAVSPWQNIPWQASIGLSAVHLMLYDNPGSHSTLEDMQRDISSFVARTGIHPRKVSAGLPFYARGLPTHGRQWSQAVSYRTLISRYGAMPTEDTLQGYALNSRNTIIAKTEYALARGLGGIMIWHLGMDSAGPASLTRAIRHTATLAALSPRVATASGGGVPPEGQDLTSSGTGLPQTPKPDHTDDPRPLAVLSGRLYQSTQTRRRQQRSPLGLPDPVHGLVPRARQFLRLRMEDHWWWEHPDWPLFVPGL